MHVTAIKTQPVNPGDALFPLLDTYLPTLSNGDIVVITSKIVSICEGSIVKNDGSVQKSDLIKKSAQHYLEPTSSKYDVSLSITDNILVAAGGIDESNGNGYYILWPRDARSTAAEVWAHLRSSRTIKNVGIVITDSIVTPLRWGTRGIGIGWCGFEPLRDYRGQPDIYGRKLLMTKLSILDGLAATAVLVMGEGNEQTPLVVIGDAPNVVFTDSPPTKEEVAQLFIEPEDDLFAPIINFDKMKKGK